LIPFSSPRRIKYVIAGGVAVIVTGAVIGLIVGLILRTESTQTTATSTQPVPVSNNISTMATIYAASSTDTKVYADTSSSATTTVTAMVQANSSTTTTVTAMVQANSSTTTTVAAITPANSSTATTNTGVDATTGATVAASTGTTEATTETTKTIIETSFTTAGIPSTSIAMETTTLTITSTVVCPTGYTQAASGQCVDLMTDFNNCGSLNFVCSSNYTNCTAGVCNGTIIITGSSIEGAFWDGTSIEDDNVASLVLPMNISLYGYETNTLYVSTNGVSNYYRYSQ
jgi:hypothetical protein